MGEVEMDLMENRSNVYKVSFRGSSRRRILKCSSLLIEKVRFNSLTYTQTVFRVQNIVSPYNSSVFLCVFCSLRNR